MSFFAETAWQTIIFKEMESMLLSESRPFPCLFGVSGFKANQLRFAFFDEMSPSALAQVLQDYLKEARNFGQNTSLVVFERPTTLQSIHQYGEKFWQLLKGVAQHDVSDWPAEIPTELEHRDWEFCFNGEPIFVVCNTPAHILRQSRRGSTFTLTFQPRWVFENILGTEKAAKAAFSVVTERLRPYDMVDKSPALGLYGDEMTREWKQYFLDDLNIEARCPFHQLTQTKENV
ncbi:MAG: YqcI/YcgG family protein [Formosimonas sp.]